MKTLSLLLLVAAACGEPIIPAPDPDAGPTWVDPPRVQPESACPCGDRGTVLDGAECTVIFHVGDELRCAWVPLDGGQ